MNVAANVFHDALNLALEGHSLNRAQARRLFNPDPEINSAAEHLVALQRDFGVPQDRLRAILGDIREVLHLNNAENDCHTDLAGRLDDLTRQVRDHELNDNSVGERFTVKQIAHTARRALAALREPGADSHEFMQAAWTLKDLFAAVPPCQLFTKSVENELGKGPYRQLLDAHASWQGGA